MGLLHSLVVQSMHLIPKPLLRRLSDRYIAGDTLAEALQRGRALESQGFQTILDVLGEDTENAAGVDAAAGDYLAAVEALRGQDLSTYISIKPTQFGLRTDPALCEAAFRRVLERARDAEVFTRVEMEDHTTTDGILDLFSRLRRDHAAVGVVIQAYLRRTLDDLERLTSEHGAGRLNVRLCKGIYVEPYELAYTDPYLVNQNYRRSLELLLRSGAFVSIATHDERIVFDALEIVDRLGLGPKDYEFAMLLGVMEPLRQVLRARGLPVRVYLPYGPQWRPYSLRRLKRNPALLGAIVRATFGLQPKRAGI